MTIYLASDHAGFELKKELIDYLNSKGFETQDLGPSHYDETDDYPDFIFPCALRVAQGKPDDAGIVIGGSGQGEAMVANKVKGIRAVVYYGNPSTGTSAELSRMSSGSDIIRLSKEHNNANILALGARFLTTKEAIEAVDLWLSTKFTGEERHIRRIEKINKLEV